MDDLTAHERDLLLKTGKAQIRRVVELPQGWRHDDIHKVVETGDPYRWILRQSHDDDTETVRLEYVRSPFGKPGDGLWLNQHGELFRDNDTCNSDDDFTELKILDVRCERLQEMDWHYPPDMIEFRSYWNKHNPDHPCKSNPWCFMCDLEAAK